MKKIALSIALTLLCFKIIAQAPGSNDASFNPNDPGFGYGQGPDNYVNTISVQNDGKSIVGGSFTNFNSTPKNHLTRLNLDGTMDGTFNIGVGSNDVVSSSIIQADGKILIGGAFTTYNNDTTCNHLARLNTDGTIDTTFHIGKGLNSEVYTIALQNDGKILIGGFFTYYDTINVNYICRLNSNGSLDTTFNYLGTGANHLVRKIGIQSDGRILVAGDFTNYNGTVINNFVRLNASGTVDGSFNTGTGPNNNVVSFTIQADSKIVIAGNFTSYNGTLSNYLARINANGTIDGSFNIGTGANNTVYSVGLQTDGKILIAGYFSMYNGISMYRLARLNTTGVLDNTFALLDGIAGNIYAMTLQNDGKILIGGTFTRYNNTTAKYITRINTDGSIDNQYKKYGTGANDYIQKIAIQSDDKILVGGQFSIYNDSLINRIVRINGDGSFDTSFHCGLGFNNVVIEILVQPDGKILIGGSFTSYNGVLASRLIRLNTDGTIDTSFNAGTGPNFGGCKMALQPDGKILIGGNFSSYNGTLINNFARLNANGTLDLTFNTGTGPDSMVNEISLQPDGKILIAGVIFTSYNGININRFARINSNGSLDGSFITGTGPNSDISSIKIQSNGKILIAGSFDFYNGSFCKKIARLNTNGTIDPTFNVGLGANSSITSLIIQSDGKIIIGGCFSTYNGVNSKQVAVLNSNGTMNTSFNSGTGVGTSCITTMLMQSDHKIVIAGDFLSYNSIGRNRIARIGGFCVIDNTPVSNHTLCSGSTTSLIVSGLGTINWFAAPTSTNVLSTGIAFITPTLSVGNYTYYAESSICAVSGQRAAITVNVLSLPNILISSSSTACLGSSAIVVANGANTYTWNTGATTSSISVIPSVSTIYSVSGTDINNCISTKTVVITIDPNCQDVWPGDANSDGIADNLDVLELGLHYTQTGSPRASTSNLWQSYFANNWTGTITNGKNINNSDCNGDGTINDDDTLAIYNNYGLTHTFKPAQTNTVNPQLSIVPDQSAVVKGSWGTASIYLGDATANINNINGVAFTVDFDNTLIETNSIYLEYQNTFLDAGQNLHFRKLDFANNKIFTATTHTVSNNVSGNGKIATLHYQIKSTLATDEILNLGISQANQSDASGAIVPLTSGSGTLMALGTSVGLQELSGNLISTNPNPTNGSLIINSKTELQKIEVVSLTGQILLSEVPTNVSYTLHLENLSNGIYFVNVYQNNRIVKREKIVLNK